MDEYTYAHFDTSKGERTSKTASLNRLEISENLQKLREGAFKRQIPTADDETLCFILTYLSAVKPQRILEIGTATGISAIAMLSVCPEAHITTVEKNKEFFEEAVGNFNLFGVQMRVDAINSDAYDALDTLTGDYDFIFMDCAKVQYIKLLPKIKKLLKAGGTLLADDVLLFGWLTGESEVPEKRRMLYKHICEYVDAVTNDKTFLTTVLSVGDGLALSVKK